MAEFKIGDEVDVRFDKSIVTAVQTHGGNGLVLTVQTADTEITFDYWAADTSVKRTGVWHDMRRCPQCSHPLAECAHRDQYDEDVLDTGS
jgi:hypothetical protein